MRRRFIKPLYARKRAKPKSALAGAAGSIAAQIVPNLTKWMKAGNSTYESSVLKATSSATGTTYYGLGGHYANNSKGIYAIDDLRAVGFIYYYTSGSNYPRICYMRYDGDTALTKAELDLDTTSARIAGVLRSKNNQYTFYVVVTTGKLIRVVFDTDDTANNAPTVTIMATGMNDSAQLNTISANYGRVPMCFADDDETAIVVGNKESSAGDINIGVWSLDGDTATFEARVQDTTTAAGTGAFGCAASHNRDGEEVMAWVGSATTFLGAHITVTTNSISLDYIDEITPAGASMSGECFWVGDYCFNVYDDGSPYEWYLIDVTDTSVTEINQAEAAASAPTVMGNKSRLPYNEFYPQYGSMAPYVASSAFALGHGGFLTMSDNVETISGMPAFSGSYRLEADFAPNNSNVIWLWGNTSTTSSIGIVYIDISGVA